MSKYPICYYKKSHHYSEDLREHRDREAFTLILEGGAIEGWRSKTSRPDSVLFPGDGNYMGGIEINSRNPLYKGHEQAECHCDLIDGRCYHDGSSLAFEQIMGLFDNPAVMYSVLRMWEPDEWKGEEPSDV